MIKIIINFENLLFKKFYYLSSNLLSLNNYNLICTDFVLENSLYMQKIQINVSAKSYHTKNILFAQKLTKKLKKM